MRRFVVPALALAALAGRPAAGQSASADSLLGRWEVVRVVDAAGRPDTDAKGLVAFTFLASGVLAVDRTPEEVRAYPDTPKQIRYRVDGHTLVLDIIGTPARAAFRFEDDRLVIRDAQAGGTATLRRR